MENAMSPVNVFLGRILAVIRSHVEANHALQLFLCSIFVSAFFCLEVRFGAYQSAYQYVKTSFQADLRMQIP